MDVSGQGVKVALRSMGIDRHVYPESAFVCEGRLSYASRTHILVKGSLVCIFSVHITS